MLKRILAGTALGSAVMGLRDRIALARALVTHPQEVGDQRNNALAAHIVVRLRRPGKTFVDIGAHIGSVLGEAARLAPGKVIAFEAIPFKADRLRKKFPGAVVHNYALLDRDGEARFFVDNKNSGYSSLTSREGDVTEIAVKMARMDDLVDDDDVDVIKIDVEGAELGVLQGADGVIARCRPVVMFESAPSADVIYTKQALWQWFADRDYQLYCPDRISRAARAMALEVFLDSHEYPRRSMNYFAIPAERLAEVSARVRTMLNEQH